MQRKRWQNEYKIDNTKFSDDPKTINQGRLKTFILTIKTTDTRITARQPLNLSQFFQTALIIVSRGRLKNKETDLMLKMPTKTLLISAAMILFAGCTTKQLPRPNAEIAELKAKEPPAAQSLPNPVKGKRFDDTWGAARSQGRRHEGVDIFAKKNTPIRSTTPGIVTKIGRNRLGGKVIGIQGPGAWHYYAHLNKFARVRLYERVKEGQVIGYVGKTGNAKTTPAHLHYGVYLPSGAINPYPLINQER